jgi:hypothetical protein
LLMLARALTAPFSTPESLLLLISRTSASTAPASAVHCLMAVPSADDAHGLRSLL